MAESALFVYGRICIALVFIISGLQKAFNVGEKGSGRPILPYVTSKLDTATYRIEQLTGFSINLPDELPLRLVSTAAVLEIMGSVLFVMQYPFGAIILAGYTLVITPIMHNFWDEEFDSRAQHDQILHALKNLALIGAFLCFLANPGNVPGVRNRTARNILKLE